MANNPHVRVANGGLWGQTIHTVAQKLVQAATALQTRVAYSFNGIWIVAVPGMLPEALVEQYYLRVEVRQILRARETQTQYWWAQPEVPTFAEPVEKGASRD